MCLGRLGSIRIDFSVHRSVSVGWFPGTKQAEPRGMVPYTRPPWEHRGPVAGSRQAAEKALLV